jgi:hypothetical protein
MDTNAAGVASLQRPVRPRAWLYTNAAGALAVHTNTELVRFEADMRAAQEHPGAHSMEPLYDQAALDAALALWPRDCRLCAKFTTQTGGCTSTVQCVDSDQYKATAPRQYWVSGPNGSIDLEPTK